MMDIIKDVSKNALLLSNSVVMVDVSGSMYSGQFNHQNKKAKLVPIHASMGLGLIISELQ
jgi:hypothetical protein